MLWCSLNPSIYWVALGEIGIEGGTELAVLSTGLLFTPGLAMIRIHEVLWELA